MGGELGTFVQLCEDARGEAVMKMCRLAAVPARAATGALKIMTLTTRRAARQFRGIHRRMQAFVEEHESNTFDADGGDASSHFFGTMQHALDYYLTLTRSRA